MSSQDKKDLESQVEAIPLYPQLQQQLQVGIDDVDGDPITQTDLDRVWKPVFEDYNDASSLIKSGCCAPSLSMPVPYLRKLLIALSREDDVDEGGFRVQISSRTQRRVEMLKTTSAPKLSGRVIHLITTKADQDGDGWVDYQEFCDVILIRHKDDLEMERLNMLRKLLNNAVKSVTPEFYDEYYTCCPPPLFIILVSLVEVAFYVYYSSIMGEFSLTGPSPLHSPLIYDPNRRHEAWRFLSYAFLHNGFVHIINNLVLQLVVGIPLEMVHGWWRVGLVYLLGSAMGSMGHSITDGMRYLLGASGGVYALLGAHGANVIINWKEMRFGILRAILLGLYVVFDISWAVYQRYSGVTTSIGYAAHAGGFLGGLFLGVVVLKNFRKFDFERVVYWICLVAFLLLAVIAVVVNVTTDCRSFCRSDYTALPKYIDSLWNRYNRN